jgi:trans-aconitate methyltransferase
MTHHTHPSATAQTQAVFQDDRMVAVLEAEGQLAAGLTDQAVQLCAELVAVGRADPLRLADLGCGPGVATTRLAAAFDGATVVGVDGSPVMLARAADRVARHEAYGRVELLLLDLDGDLRELGSFDLVWAALALHHTVDEHAALDNFAALLRPEGLLCLLERADPMVVHPAHDLGQPGIWDRVEVAQSAWYDRTRGALPGVTNVAAYGDMLQHAGLELLDTRTLTDTVTAPVEPALQPVIARYVRAAIHNLRDTLAPADVEALTDVAERVTDVAWGDALVTSTRTLFIARKTEAT